MLHGPIDKLYVLPDAMCPYIVKLTVPFLGFCALRRRATPSRTLFVPERSSGHPRGLSPLCRRSLGSSLRPRSSKLGLSISGRAPTSSIWCVYPSKTLRLSHHVVHLQVYLDDLIDLYRRVFERILSRELAEKSPYTRYYLGTSNPLAWKEIATCFGKTLHSLGKIENAEPQSITVADIPKILYKMMNDGAEPQSATDLSELAECVWLCPTLSLQHSYALDSNPAVVYFSASQNVRAERAKALGWKPRPVVLDPDDDWVDGIKAALRAFEAEAAAKA